MYTSIWHLRQDVPLAPSHPVPSHPVLSHPIPSSMGQLVAIGAGLGQLVHIVHQCIQAYNGISGKISHLSCPILSYPILSCPVWANWWLLVLGWDNWSTWSINVYRHISGKMSHLSCPVPSHPVPSCPVWANWWLLVLGEDNWSTYSINVTCKHI